MKTKVAIGIVLLALLVGAGVVYAQSTVDLQPTYRLMNGEEELGVVYGFDYGWLVVTENDTLFTCGCGEAGCYDGTEVVPSNTPVPSETPPPTDEPDKEKCNRGIGNNSEGCDPGNSSGQGQGAGRDAGEDRNEAKPTKKPK